VQVPSTELSGIVPLPISVADNEAAAFLPLAGEASLPRVVHMLLGAVAELDRVVVAAAEQLVDDARENLASQSLSSVSVAAITGAATRAQCLAAALEHLESKALSTPYVLVHDISQPLASADARDRVVAGLRSGNAVVVPALPVTDSVKAVDARGSVTATLDRSMLQAVQYPRGFATDQLAQLLAQRASEEFDELEEAIHAGVPITLVEGDTDGFRTNLPRDAQFVEAVIASRPPGLRG
jgi:2-C-methyl-D-erythritol 4-phosphate cytidylyltransferase